MTKTGNNEDKLTAEPNNKNELIFPKDSKWSWIACFCAFQTNVLILGILHGFGVIFVEFTKEFKTTKGNAAWISSVAYGISMFSGPASSILSNKYGHRCVMMIGAALCAIANLTSSFVTSFPILFGSFSVIFGIGASLAITCTVTISQEYFDKYITITMGVISAGSSVGTLVMAPLSHFLVTSVGWRNALRVFAGTCGFSMICNILLFPISRKHKTPLQQVRSSPLRKLMEDLKLWKNRVFIVWTCAITSVMFGYYIPYVHLVAYASDCGISSGKASILIMILGASTASGRILFGKIVQFGILDRIRMHQLSMVVTGTGTIFLPMITTFPGIAAYIVVVGLVDGCYVVLLPLLTCSIVGTERMMLAWGFLIGTSSITFTLGPPVAGFLYDSTGSYNVAFHIAGIPILSGAVMMFLIPWAQRTSTKDKILQELQFPRTVDEEDVVDFITLSRVPSIASKITLIGSHKDSESVQPESPSVLESEWGTYFVNNRNRVTILPGNIAFRPGMRDVDFDLSLLERNDQVLSEMLRASGRSPASPMRFSGPALIVSSSPRCHSCRNNFMHSEVINISSSTPRRRPRYMPSSREEVDEPVGVVNDAACQTDLSFSIHSQDFDNVLQGSYASPSRIVDQHQTLSKSPGYGSPVTGITERLRGTPKLSTPVFKTIHENVSRTDQTDLQERTEDQRTKERTADTASPHSPSVTNAQMESDQGRGSPLFYTSHNKKDKGASPKPEHTDSGYETLPVDIPAAEPDITTQCSDDELFQMELPPSPPANSACIPLLPLSPSPQRERLVETPGQGEDTITSGTLSDATAQTPPKVNKLSSSPLCEKEFESDTEVSIQRPPDSTLESASDQKQTEQTQLDTPVDIETPSVPVKTASATTVVTVAAVFVMDPLTPPSVDNYLPPPLPEDAEEDHENQKETIPPHPDHSESLCPQVSVSDGCSVDPEKRDDDQISLLSTSV